MVLSVLNIKKDFGIPVNCVFFFFSLPFPFPFYSSYFSHAIYILFPIRPMLSFPDGLFKTLHCSVPGRGISGLLRSGVHLSVNSPFVDSFHFVCLFGKPGAHPSFSFLFSLLVSQQAP